MAKGSYEWKVLLHTSVGCKALVGHTKIIDNTYIIDDSPTIFIKIYVKSLMCV